MRGKCAKCSIQISSYIRYRSGKLNKTPFQMCLKCFRETGSRDKSVDGRDRIINKRPFDGESESSAIMSFIGEIYIENKPLSGSTQTTMSAVHAMSGQLSTVYKHTVVLDHHIFTSMAGRRLHLLHIQHLGLEFQRVGRITLTLVWYIPKLLQSILMLLRIPGHNHAYGQDNNSSTVDLA